jgi:hypothetical protein
MDTTCSFPMRSFPRAATVAKVLAGLVVAAGLAGIYPVAAALASTLAMTWRTNKAEPAALAFVSAGAAERNSLGLRFVRLPASAPALSLLLLTTRAAAFHPTREE